MIDAAALAVAPPTLPPRRRRGASGRGRDAALGWAATLAVGTALWLAGLGLVFG